VTSTAKQAEITDTQANDHERQLAALRSGLNDVGHQSLLVDFHGITLRGSDYHNPTRREPELSVFWPGERDGIALTVHVSGDVYDWGSDRHPISDVVGAVGAIAAALDE
jgi:hypothetical protein